MRVPPMSSMSVMVSFRSNICFHSPLPPCRGREHLLAKDQKSASKHDAKRESRLFSSYLPQARQETSCRCRRLHFAIQDSLERSILPVDVMHGVLVRVDL